MNGRLVLRTTGATHRNTREFAASEGFAITHVSTLADGVHRVILHGDTPFGEWVVPDTDGRLTVATKQPAVPPHFDFVPAPKQLPLVQPVPPRGGVFFMRWSANGRTVSLGQDGDYMLTTRPPTADDLFVSFTYDDGADTKVGALRSGEVAFFTSPNFAGGAVTFRSPYDDLNLDIYPVIGRFRSLRLGPRTAVTIGDRPDGRLTPFLHDQSDVPNEIGLLFPWIQASRTSAPVAGEVALYTDADFGGVGRVYSIPQRVTLHGERLTAPVRGVATGVKTGVALFRLSARQNVWDAVPDLVTSSRFDQSPPDEIQIVPSGSRYGGRWALHMTEGFWRAQGTALHVAPAIGEDELFTLAFAGRGPRQYFIHASSGRAVHASGNRLVIGPSGAGDLLLVKIELDSGTFALRTPDGQWVTYAAGAFELVKDESRRAVITPVKVAASENELGPLEPGEIALYEQQNYWGKVWIVNAAWRKAADLNGLATIRSVRPGPGTGATLYASPDWSGPSADVLVPIPSLVEEDRITTVGSIDVWSAIDVHKAPFVARAILLREYEQLGSELLEASVYRTSVRLRDGWDGTSLVSVGATEALQIRVAGESHAVDDHVTAQVAPNVALEVSVSFAAHDIVTPALKLRVPSMAAGSFVVFHPDEDVHQRLATLTAQELTNPARPLMPPGQNAEHVAVMVRTAMRTIGHSDLSDPQAQLAKGYLAVGDVMLVGDFLASADGKSFATLEADGTLAVFRGRGPDDNRGLVWESGVARAEGDFFATLRDDGALSVFEGLPDARGALVWSSPAAGHDGPFYATVHDDGDVVVYRGTSPQDYRGFVWSSAGRARVSLATNQGFFPGEWMRSPNGRFFIILQGDGNLAVFRGAGPADQYERVWQSGVGTKEHPPYATLQNDGTFVVGFQDHRGVIWSSGTTADGGVFFAMVRDDGVFAVYKGTSPDDNRGLVWSSNGTKTPVLAPGESLAVGDHVASHDGRFFVALDRTGRLSVREGASPGDAGHVVWQSSARGEPGEYRAALDPDGRFVVRHGTDHDGAELWASHTAVLGGPFFAAIREDGRFGVFRGTGVHDEHDAVWTSPSRDRHIAGTRPLRMRATAGTRMVRPVRAGGNLRLTFHPDGSTTLVALSDEDAAAVRAASPSVVYPTIRSLLDAARRGTAVVQSISVAATSGLVNVAQTAGRSVTSWVNLQMEVLVDGVRTFVPFVLHRVEDVLDWVSLTFKQVGVAIHELHEWLAAAFSWAEILKTKRAFVDMYRIALPILRANIGSVGATINAEIDAIYEEFRRDIAGWRAALRKTDTSIRTGSNRSRDSRAAAAAGGVQGGWITSKFADNAGGVRLEMGGSSMHDPADAALVAMMAADRDALLTPIEAFFTQLIAEPGRFVELSLDGLLGLLEALAGIAVRGLKAAVSSASAAARQAVDLFDELARHPIDVPFISALYRDRISGDVMTVLDLVALLVAVPSTLIAAVLHDVPGDAAAAPPFHPPDLQTRLEWAYLGNLMTAFSFLNAVVDSPFGIGPAALPINFCFLAAAGYLQMASPPGTDEDYGRRFGAAFFPAQIPKTPLYYEMEIWTFQWFQWAIDVGVFLYVGTLGKVKRTAAPWSQVLDTMLGVVHLIAFNRLRAIEMAEHVPHALLKFLELTAFGVQELPRGLRAIPPFQIPYVYWALSAIDLAGTETSGAIHAVRIGLPPAHPEVTPT